MKKDIYDLLNNGNFDEEGYENINKEEFDDLTIKKVERYVRGKSKVRKKNNKIKVVASVATVIFIVGIWNSSFGTEVLASVSNMIRKIDPNKNYKSDYVVELGNSYSENGVEVRFDECYRNRNELRLVYTMNFENGVPESIKAKERARFTDETVEGLSYEYIDYENNGNVEGCKISINDWVMSDLSSMGYYNCRYGVVSYQSRDIEINEKSIKKELIFSIDGLTIKDDLNIKIEYENMVDNSGEEIKGPWLIEHKVKAEDGVKDIVKTNLDRDYGHNFEDGNMITIDSYANTNTGIKIFGKGVSNRDKPVVTRLEGVDNLGNKICMYPISLDVGDNNTASDISFEVYDGQTGNRQPLEEGVTSLKLRLYGDLEMRDNFIPVGDEFTINIQ